MVKETDEGVIFSILEGKTNFFNSYLINNSAFSNNFFPYPAHSSIYLVLAAKDHDLPVAVCTEVFSLF